MPTYSISYDLNSPNRNYSGVISKIKSIANGYCKTTESHLFINSTLTAREIRDAIKLEMDNGDSLMVNSVGDNWATKGIPDTTNEWLQNSWQSSCRV